MMLMRITPFRGKSTRERQIIPKALATPRVAWQRLVLHQHRRESHGGAWLARVSWRRLAPYRPHQMPPYYYLIVRGDATRSRALVAGAQVQEPPPL